MAVTAWPPPCGPCARYTDQVTAIVSVADDGGSSGRLRELLQIIPPGDLRKCLVALAEPGSLLAVAFEYRFGEEELAGHSLGNLILAGLIDGAGDPVAALDEACRLLGVRGRVLPATTDPVVLKADADGGPGGRPGGGDGHRQHPDGVAGAGRPQGPRRRRWPPWPRPTRSSWAPGPCSPACWPPSPCPTSGTASAGPRRPKVYVCNLRPQVPETESFDVAMHVEALVAHGVAGGRGGVRHRLALPLGEPPRRRWSTPRWPGPTGWPTTRPNWRRSSPICSDERLVRPDALAWTPVSCRSTGHEDSGPCGRTHGTVKGEAHRQ